jgi:hypothetical protein
VVWSGSEFGDWGAEAFSFSPKDILEPLDLSRLEPHAPGGQVHHGKNKGEADEQRREGIVLWIDFGKMPIAAS